MEGGGRAAADIGGGTAYGGSASQRRTEGGREAEAGADGGRGREAEAGYDGGRGRLSTRIDPHGRSSRAPGSNSAPPQRRMEGGGHAAVDTGGGTAHGGSASQWRTEAGREAEAGTDGGRGREASATEGIDYVWSHGDQIGVGFKCKYCLTTFLGGGATRLRQHLAGIIGNVKSCQQVPSEVRDAMRTSDRAGKQRRRQAHTQKLRIEREIYEEMNAPIDVPSDEDLQEQMAINASLRDLHFRERVERSGGTYEHGCGSGSGGRVSAIGSNAGTSGSTSRIHTLFRNARSAGRAFDYDIARSKSPQQTRVDTLFGKNNKTGIGEAWAKWFHANDIPGVKADCPYFKGAIKLTQNAGKGVQIPRGIDIDGPYLEANFAEMEGYMAKFKEDWPVYGVTVMCDSWTGPTSMSIINFMIYCNERMFFHKSVNATGHMQNSEYLYDCIKHVVVDEIGPKLVVQIVTDNGSNFKKACAQLVLEYPHIIWQPCAAHTVNLMMKDIGNEPEVENVIRSAKRICRFFYNHGRLHAEMKKNIGGELIRPNATRFGTMYIFLQSFWDRKDKFRQWMVSEAWRNNAWSNDPDYEYTDSCLTSSAWWVDVKWVLDTVQPLYRILRFADTQKKATMSGFMPLMMGGLHEMEAHLSGTPRETRKFMSLVKMSVKYLYKNTLMVAAGVLDPEAHYKYGYGKNPIFAKALKKAIEKIADSPQSEVQALAQFDAFHSCRGEFDSRGARLASSQMSPSAWWYMYGGHAKVLQKYAMKIVSQCVSSSGGERNWSTFALVHTKVRNRLGYDKLHKLVYVHYNLKLRLQMQEADRPEKELDPCAVMMDTALHDQDNPMMDWLSRSIRESEPVMDEPGDPPTPSRVVLEEVRVVLEDPPVPSRVVVEDLSMPSSSRVVPGKSGEALLDKPLNVWISKRKRLDITRKKKAKKGRKDEDEDDVESGEDTSTPSRSLSYVDTDDSTSVSDDVGDDDVVDLIGGGDITKVHTKKTGSFQPLLDCRRLNMLMEGSP